MAYSEEVLITHEFATLQSLSLAPDALPTGIQVHSTITVEYDGHKVSYRVTGMSGIGSVASGRSVKLDLEIAKIYY